MPGQAIHVVTAHNPAGRDCDSDVNAAAQERLEAELTQLGLPWWQAAGGDPEWQHVEASAAIVGLDRQSAVEIGRRYEREAIFEITASARVIIDCRDGSITSTGWIIKSATCDLSAPARLIQS